MTLSELTPPLPHSTHCHQLCYRSAEACLRSFGRWHCNPNSYIFTFLKYDIWLLRKNHLDINLANSLFLSCLCCRRMKAILRWTKVPRLNNQLRTCGCIAQIWWQFFLGRFAQTMQTCKGLGMFWWGKANRFLLAGLLMAFHSAERCSRAKCGWWCSIWGIWVSIVAAQRELKSAFESHIIGPVTGPVTSCMEFICSTSTVRCAHC